MTYGSGADPDAVVIGAGHNGLVAANLLADSGWAVTVLEATDRLGGAVRSDEICAPGYMSDVFSAFYPLGGGSPVLRELNLGEYGLRWTHAPAVLAHALEDGRAAVLHRDVDATAASVDEWARGDGDAWRRIVEGWQRIRDPMLDVMLRPFPPVGAGARLARSLGPADLLRFARFAVLPVRRYVEEEFRGEGAQLLIAGNALHTDLSPDSAASGLFGWLLAMLGQDVGFPVPQGGAGRLIDALALRAESRGVQIVRNAPVDRIVVRNGRALGVVTGDGDAVRARRAVLADVTAPALYGRLLEPEVLPERLLDDLQRFQWDNPTLKLDWALSGPIPWKAPAAATAGTVHLGVDMAGLTDYAADLTVGRRPLAPFLLLGQMTTSDPSRSPAGTETVWAYTHLSHNVAADASAVAAHVELVEEVVERHAPGFRDLIVGRHVLTPARLEEEDPSLVAGAVNGGTASLHQLLVFRPLPGTGRAETPVQRLYLASASAHPGGGVHGACGANAAHAALLADNPIGRVTAAGWRAIDRTLRGT